MNDYPEKTFVGTVGNELTVRLYSDGEIGFIVTVEHAEPEAHCYLRKEEVSELIEFLKGLLNDPA